MFNKSYNVTLCALYIHLPLQNLPEIEVSLYDMATIVNKL